MFGQNRKSSFDKLVYLSNYSQYFFELVVGEFLFLEKFSQTLTNCENFGEVATDNLSL